MGKEDRRFPRFRVALPVELKDRNHITELLTADASRHGVFLRTDSPKPVRQLLQLTFQLPNGIDLEVMGMVARSVAPAEAGPMGPGMGVDFFAMSKGSRDTWENFVRTLVHAKEMAENEPEEEPAEQPDAETDAPADAEEEPRPAAADELAMDPPETDPAFRNLMNRIAPRRERKGTRLDMLFDELPDGASLPEMDGDDSPPPPPPEPQTGTGPLPVRRKQVRFVASFMVRLKDRKRLRDFYTRDIGGGGMFLKTPLLKKAGDDVQLVLIHPETDQEFRLGGTVAHASKDAVMAKRGMGIRFHPRNAEAEEALLDFIETGAEYLDPPPDERESTITALKTATEVAPDSPKAHFSLGRALLDQDKLPEALEELNRALQTDTNYLPAHRALQEVYTRTGETAKAFEHLRQVKRLEREGWRDTETV